MSNQDVIRSLEDKLRMLTHELLAYEEQLRITGNRSEQFMCQRNISRIAHLRDGYMTEIDRIKDTEGER